MIPAKLPSIFIMLKVLREEKKFHDSGIAQYSKIIFCDS